MLGGLCLNSFSLDFDDSTGALLASSDAGLLWLSRVRSVRDPRFELLLGGVGGMERPDAVDERRGWGCVEVVIGGRETVIVSCWGGFSVSLGLTACFMLWFEERGVTPCSPSLVESSSFLI